MPDTDPYAVTDVDTLRAIVGEPSPVVQVKLWTGIEPPARAFIERSPFLVLATSDAEGRVDVSPKGDAPGFVLVEDERTLVIPDRPGNKLVFGLQNVLANPHVGLVFVVPGTTETLRVNGRARLTRDPALCARLAARGRPALLAIRVEVEECFFHCGKAFLRSELWKPETWPGYRVSFGRMLGPKLGAGDELVAQIDAAIAADYEHNL